MVYGITNGGSEGDRILRNTIAIALQPCGQCRGGGGKRGGSCRVRMGQGRAGGGGWGGGGG